MGGEGDGGKAGGNERKARGKGEGGKKEWDGSAGRAAT